MTLRTRECKTCQGHRPYSKILIDRVARVFESANFLDRTARVFESDNFLDTVNITVKNQLRISFTV